VIREKIIQRARRTKHGFTDIQKIADEIIESDTSKNSLRLAKTLFSAEAHQARMVAAFVLGRLAARSEESLAFLRGQVSNDTDWRVQEILAKAFDRYCSDTSYKKALPVIKEWIMDENPNVRRAVSEGLRIWTSRDYFKDHPEIAIKLLSRLKDDESDYVRKSAGNALRDISKKHGELVREEVCRWDISKKSIEQTYKLASRLL
jgi:3-methyladenine DNA glycosylase AlkC